MLSLADAIIQEDFDRVQQLIRAGEDVNALDIYGFRPLIEAAIVDNAEIIKFLLANGANPNLHDATGGSALHWAAENNNITLTKLLLSHHANPNAYNLAGQPVLVMPTLRRQSALRSVLVKAGANEAFSQDYINTKLLGHMYELIGNAMIISPDRKFVEVDFEGFYLEITVGLISDSLSQFQNHFAARQLRRYSGISQFIVEVMQRASQLIKYQQYRVDIKKYSTIIDELIEQDPVIIPVGYEGHAITFIRYGDIWVKCDRREDSRLYDNVMFYRVGNPQNLTTEFIKNLMYVKQSDQFINTQIDRILGLTPITELKVEAQISGNCSWANVEATIPALFFLVLMQFNKDSQSISYFKTLALNYFHRWREWNKDRALHYCINSFEQSDPIHKACKAEILAAILFQRCDVSKATDYERMEMILSLLLKSPYEYLLKNYLRIYYYEGFTEKGKRFFELLKEHGYRA